MTMNLVWQKLFFIGYIIYVTLCIILTSNVSKADDCTFTKNGKTLDLTDLDTAKLSYTSEGSTTFTFDYTPCRNGLDCDAVDDDDDTSDNLGLNDYMATQQGNNCFYLATWDDSVEPDLSGSTWTFTYANGESGRVFVAKYKCGSGDATVKTVDEDSDTSTYTMEIEYSGACTGSGSSSDDDGLSLGSILLISVVGVIFLYCVIGYVICAKKNPENGWGNVKANTPHLSFWCLIPRWTWAGCCVTKEFIIGLVNKLRGGGGDDSSYDTVDDGAA